MAVNRFVLNGISYHGHGAINEIPGIVKSKGFKKAFVASDPDLVKFGVTAKVTDLLKENGIEYELYSDIKPNPTIDVQTYKEIVAFSEGQLLDDIQKQREIGKRPYQKFLLVIGSGLITFAVCILIGFLMHVFLN